MSGTVMAEELEISLRTLYRDIATLMAEGVPITGEAGVGYVIEDGYDLPPLMFTAAELEALILGLRWVARRGDTELVRAARDSATKIATVLPQNLKPLLFDATLLAPPPKDQAVDFVDIAILRKALREGRKISINYRKEDGEHSTRTLWPIALGYFDNQKIVAGWCELRGDFRHFRTDRILNLRVSEERFKTPRRLLLRQWYDHMNLHHPIKNFELLM